MSNPDPQPLPRFKRDPSDLAPRYTLDDPFAPAKSRRPVRPKQQCVASVVGKIRAGGEYLVLYNDAEASEDGANALHGMLERLGKRFVPPVKFHLLPQATGVVDLTLSWNYKSPFLLPPMERSRPVPVYEGIGRS